MQTRYAGTLASVDEPGVCGAEPRVEVWLPGERWMGVIDEVSDHPERIRLLRAVLVASGFAAPAAGIDPRRLDDEALAAATSSYRLLRIRHVAAA